MARILIHGSGAREHAQARAFLNQGNEVAVTPGNFGMAQCGILNHLSDVDLEIYSMDSDLVAGKAELPSQSKIVFGPTKNAAALEGSKIWCKEILGTIPTAKYKIIEKSEDIERIGVLKYDGLAAGKGVYVPKTLEDLKTTAKSWLEKKEFGNERFFVEEFLEGYEASIFLICNGTQCSYFGSAKDYKRRFDQNAGPNTGGMGSVSPHPQEKREWKTTFEAYGNQILENLNSKGISYKGFMFLGIMWVQDVPYVLEINARLGDPETQSLLPRVRSNLYQLYAACAQGKDLPKIELLDGFYSCIVGVQKDYPSKVMEDLEEIPVFKNYLWSGLSEGNKISGRVCSAVAKGKDLKESLKKSYDLIKQIKRLDYRNDIGL